MTTSGLVRLMDYDLGYFDGLDDSKIRRAKSVTHVTATNCYPCHRA